MKTPLLLTAMRQGLLLLLACALHAQRGQAQTPQYMTYQGYLTDQSGNALGTNGPQNYDIVFRIWNQPTGGGSTPLFGELQTVTVANGYFSVLLGQGSVYVAGGGGTDPHPLLSTVFTTNNISSTARYVELTVKGLNNGADVVILPRLQLVSAPYAFMAANANALVSTTTGNNIISSSGSGVTISGSLTNTGGSIYMDNGTQIFAKNTSGVYEQCFYPRWTDNVTYLDYGTGGFNIRNDTFASTMWMGNNGLVGIGTVSPISSLGYPGGWGGLHIDEGSGNGLGVIEGSVSARLHLRNDAGTASVTQDFVIDNTGNYLNFRWLGGGLGNRDNIMTFDPSGNVGIGATTPGATLDVLSGSFLASLIDSPAASGTWNVLRNSSVGGVSWQLISTGSGNGEGAGKLLFDHGTAPGSAAGNVMTLQQNGDVGIGTTSPGWSLQVNGGVVARGGLPGGNGVNNNGYAFSGNGGDDDSGMFSTTDGYLEFCVNSSPTMTLNPSGVGIGTTTPSAPLDVEHTPNTGVTQDYLFMFNVPGDANGAGVLQSRTFAAGGPYNLELFQGQAYKPGGGSWGVVSDIRLKKDVRNLSGALDSLMRLRSVTFEYKDPASVHEKPGRHTGFIAQEVEKIFPEWVATAPNGMKSVGPVGFESLTVQALREMRTEKDSQIRSLSDQNAELEKRLEKLEAREARIADLEEKASQTTALTQEVADLKKLVMQLAAASKNAKLAADIIPASQPMAARGAQTAPITTASLDK